MFINQITIENFRQLIDTTIYLEDSTTVLAGPNNSGKTTVTMLLKNIFLEPSFKLKSDDLPAIQRNEWAGKIHDLMLDGKVRGISDSDMVDEIINYIFDENSDNLIPKFNVKFKISYNNTDDIRCFSDYIMDLDEDKQEFYFIYYSEVKKSKFLKILTDKYNKIKNKSNIDTAKSMILKLYVESLEQKCCFCDKNYDNTTEIDLSIFRNLFNFQCISAARPVTEYGSEDAKGLTKELISLASDSEVWKEKIKHLPDQIVTPIQNSLVKEYVQQVSSEILNTALEEIDKTNGKNTGRLHLGMDIDEDDIKNLVNRILQAMYSKDGVLLNESSQGLGYSNLIYMHIILQKYIKTYTPYKINFFLIEEPESHMHPQMQIVFAKYLFKQYDIKNIQGLITTHSNDIVRCSSLSKLRVIRSEDIFTSKVYNMNVFKKQVVEDDLFECDKEILENFYDYFFEIGFSDLIFSDAVIFYEGDTERLYLRKIITTEDFQPLQEKYISFVQVGGTYAYNYKSIIEFLKIKSLIITDIDYNKDVMSIDDINKSQSSNNTINQFYRDSVFGPLEKEITVEKLYSWISNNNIVVHTKIDEKEEDLIYLAFQTQKDNYTRTLESAMLSKKFSIDSVSSVKRSEWIKLRTTSKLNFSIPNNKKNKLEDGTMELEQDSSFNLQDILNSTSNSKTDFMYSVIMNGYGIELLPDYISEGLKWLID